MANRCCARVWFTFINEDIGINGIKTHVDVSPAGSWITAISLLVLGRFVRGEG
jgi:hypothetical protein